MKLTKSAVPVRSGAGRPPSQEIAELFREIRKLATGEVVEVEVTKEKVASTVASIRKVLAKEEAPLAKAITRQGRLFIERL